MKKHLLHLLEYESWANELVIQAALKARSLPSQAQSIFSHLLAAREIWYYRLKQEKSSIDVWTEYPLKDWGAINQKQTKAYQDLINAYEEADLKVHVPYQSSEGEDFENTPKEILTHLELHAAYHRGQVIRLLKGQVDTLPSTDYIFFVRRAQS